MMKSKKRVFWTLIIFVFTGVLFTSCKEQKPPGLDLGDGILAIDSSYTATLESKQDKVVLFEEKMKYTLQLAVRPSLELIEKKV